MIADPVDRWSAVISTVWEFGDGATATGTAVNHSYHDPGDYTVTVSSADAVGNTTTTHRQITIAAPAAAAPIPLAPSSGPSDAPRPAAPPACSTTSARVDGRPIGVTIDTAARYVNRTSVELTITAPDNTTGVTISNDGGFTSSRAVPLQASRHYAWILDSSRPERLPKTVYVRFAGGCIDGAQTYSDDIILDQTAPKVDAATVGTVHKGRAATAHLHLTAQDNASGVTRVEIRSRTKMFAARYRAQIVLPRAFSPTAVRVRDGAGNASTWHAISKGRAR